ncbi:ATP synthase f chain, mitochondrial precursor [Umbelopsis sp. WA50703]
MSTILRRAYSTKTLIPPNLAAARAVGGAKQESARMGELVSFYKNLPKGQATPVKPSGLIGRYKAKYFDGENASATPVVHAIFLIGGISYAIDYHFHLKHHKNVEHH